MRRKEEFCHVVVGAELRRACFVLHRGLATELRRDRYDGALRITSERYYTSAGELNDELTYTYDADGNRASKTRQRVVSTYHYASGARLTGITTAGVTESGTTDNGGRET